MRKNGGTKQWQPAMVTREQLNYRPLSSPELLCKAWPGGRAGGEDILIVVEVVVPQKPLGSRQYAERDCMETRSSLCST